MERGKRGMEWVNAGWVAEVLHEEDLLQPFGGLNRRVVGGDRQ